MRKIAIGLSLALISAASLAGTVLADGAPQHTHQIATPGQGDPTIGQGFCQEAAHNGFHQFHSTVHLGGVFNSSDQVLITGTTLCD